MGDPLQIKNRFALPVASFISVLVIYHICYGLHTLIPGNTAWLMSIKHDWGAHYLGWLYYRNEPWHLPIGGIENYFYPAGTNIAFTDSIPLLAIFFKLFSFVLPGDFQYFGIWLLACHALAAWFTIKLCRQFGIKDLYAFLAVLLVTANPILIYRGLHPALCAHWLLIAAMYVYFLEPKITGTNKILLYQLKLLVISALINPYLCGMIIGFTFVTAIKLYWADKSISWKKLLGYLGVSIGILLFIGLIVGTITFTKKENVGVEGGYGLYGLNLHALYNSFGFSSIFPGIKQVSDHQYEGFMYLGLGFFVLVVFLVFYYSSKILARTKVSNSEFISNRTLWPLLFLIIAYTLFAISHVITINDRVLLQLPVPGFVKKLGDIFRASARFFWPVYYMILFFLLYKLYRTRFTLLVKTSFLLIIVLLQFYDTKRIFTYRDLTKGKYQLEISEAHWQSLIDAFDTVVIYPPFNTTNLVHIDYQDFTWLTAKAKKPITTGYVARVNDKKVQAYKQQLAEMFDEGALYPRTLFITTADHLQYFSYPILSGTAKLNWANGYYYVFDTASVDLQFMRMQSEWALKNADKVSAGMKKLRSSPEFSLVPDSVRIMEGPIKFNLEQFNLVENGFTAGGWAYNEQSANATEDSVLFILKSDNKMYYSPVISVQRPDVSSHFSRKDLDNSGFSGRFLKPNIEKGKYRLGVATRKNNTIIYTLTDKFLNAGINEFADIRRMGTLPAEGNMKVNAETISAFKDHFLIQGWAFLDNLDATDSRIDLVLKNNTNDAYIFLATTDPMSRPDIAPYFKSRLNLDNAGFVSRILKNSLPPGQYLLGVMIRNEKNGLSRILWTDKIVGFNKD